MSLFSKNAFGLDISDASIEVLEIKRSFSKLTIVAYGRVELEPGVIDHGRILNKEKLVEAIRVLLNATQPRHLSSRNAVLSLPESQTYTHIFQLPAIISEEHVGDAVRYEAEETIPLPFYQTYHDYRIITKEAGHQEVLYVACQKEVVEAYQEVLGQVGLKPVAFETESISLARSLAMEDMFEGIVLVDLGARTTIITIYDHQGVRYSKNVPIAGNHFTEQIAQSLHIPIAQAETLKREVGLGRQEKTATAVGSFTLEPLIDQIIKEISKAVAYHQKRTTFMINRIVLCGGTSLMPGLREYLQTKLKSIIVERGNPLVGLHGSKKTLAEQEAVLYATVIGLALRGAGHDNAVSDVNLLRHEAEHKKFTVSHEFKPAKGVKAASPATITRPASKRTTILIAIFIFFILVFVGVFFLQRGRQEPLIKFQNTNYSTNSNGTTAAAVAIAVQSDLSVYTAPSGTMPAGAIRGRLMEKTLTGTKEFSATGKRTADQVARGTVTLINNYSANQSLVATTRLLTTTGVLFRLKNSTTVPAHGRIEAETYADEPGKDGDVSPPMKLTIPGLSPSLQSSIYGELSKSTTGGDGEVSYVLDTDLQKAKEAVQQAAATPDLEAFKVDIQSGEVLFPKLLSSAIQEPTFSATVGQATTAFSASWQTAATALALVDQDILGKLNEQLTAAIPQGKSVDDYQLADRQYTLQSFDKKTGLVSIQISSQARLR